MQNILIKLYWIIFGLLNLGVIYQLINPNIPKPPDSSGLGIIQGQYLIPLTLYLFYTSLFGIWLLFKCYKNKYNSLKYLVAINFILTIPIFLFAIDNLSHFLARYNYFINLKIMNPVWSWIILGQVFFIIQAILLYFFNKPNDRDV